MPGETLKKLAKALNIDTIQLFDITDNSEGSLQQLEQSLITNIKQAVKEAVKEQCNEFTAIQEKPIKTKTKKK